MYYWTMKWLPRFQILAWRESLTKTRIQKRPEELQEHSMNTFFFPFHLLLLVITKISDKANAHIQNSGYMSPEYAMEGLFSVKSDVFSFGVILLEILSGKKNSGFYHTELAPTLLAYVRTCLPSMEPSVWNKKFC